METDPLKFDIFNFEPRINAAVKTAGYSEPTPIQLKAIPLVLSGKDILGIAQTGTGKTAAFALPLIQKLLLNQNPREQRPSAPKRRVVRALILVPTRELADQVLQAVRSFSTGTELKSSAIYGGAKYDKQVRVLKNGTDIVVACPGRLLDHIRRRTIDLSKVEYLVLDEADQMFDMGFMKDVRSIVSSLPKKRQTLMFSATMPKEIKALALEVLTEPLTVEAGKPGMAQTVSHALYPISEDGKNTLLISLLKESGEGSVLVFTRTKHRAKRLSEKLSETSYSTTCLQGNLSQARRREAMEGFRSGKYRIMVATDIAARGIDISTVSHVINYDIPDTVEAYTHRIGRTGRAAKTGSALTLITRKDESMVRQIEGVLKGKIKRVVTQEVKVAETASPQRSSSDNRHRAFGSAGRRTRHKRPRLSQSR